MTPGARVASAIEILHDMADGLAAEQALTRWARRSRSAGSKDRAAIRDHVFDVLRCRNEAAYYGKSNTPRAIVIGMLHMQRADLESLFSGEGHAPAPLNDAERIFPSAPTDTETLWNLPEWLVSEFQLSLGDKAQDTARALTSRAPVTLRVHTGKTSVERAQQALEAEGVSTELNPVSPTALTVTEGARKIRNSVAYQDGLVELQDAASQAVTAALPAGGRVLDYCAGGGGKSLALASDLTRQVTAHDIDPRRMNDLPARAARAGATIDQCETKDLRAAGPFDVVLCDAPCSGSGSWRRSPEGKWTLTPDRLGELTALQDSILDEAAALVASGGLLAYATCSVLKPENKDRIDAFLTRHPAWSQSFSKRFDVTQDGDGFFTAHLMRNQ